MATAVDVARELTLRQANYYHATRTATSGGNPHLSASFVMIATYLAQGWSLAIRGVPLVDEPFIYRDRGPAVRSLWPHLADNFMVGPEHFPRNAPLTEDERIIVRSIYRQYGACTGLMLTSAPFDKFWRGLAEPGQPIPHEAIRARFAQRLNIAEPVVTVSARNRA